MTPGATGGMEWYVRGLIDHLAKLDDSSQYLLVLGPMNYNTFSKPGPNWKTVLYEGSEVTPPALASAYNSILKNQRIGFLHGLLRKIRTRIRQFRTPVWKNNLSALLKKENIDIWFCPLMYSLPIDVNMPVVNTIPDLQHEYYPDLLDPMELRYRNLGYQYSCKAATATIAISNTTAEDIVSLYGIDPEEVFAIPISLDPSFQIPAKAADAYFAKVKSRYNLRDEYVYFPANGWPHKNHEKLVEAMYYVREKGFDLELILSGSPFDLWDRLKPILSKFNLEDTVRHLGYIDRQEVIGLYTGAKMLAFPSTFEGFGIPLLEAMSLGTPVVCSNVTSLPEVGGDAAIYFDPKEPKSIAEAIMAVAGNDGLRRKMVQSGNEQVKNFHYEKTAKQTYEIFRKIYEGELKNPQLEPPRGLLPWNWLLNGHSRFYFHCRCLKWLRIEALQQNNIPGLKNQRIKICLNDRVEYDADMTPGKTQEIFVKPQQNPSDGFYRLDIIASAKRKIGDQSLSLRIPKIELVDARGRTVDLV